MNRLTRFAIYMTTDFEELGWLHALLWGAGVGLALGLIMGICTGLCIGG